MSVSPKPSSVRLRDLAVFIRSKNAGPFVLTIDIFFAGLADYHRVIESNVLNGAAIGAIYRIDPASIKIIHVAQAFAIKVSLPRPLAAGDVGDCDVAGGQQFAPIMDVMIPA